MYHVPYIYIIYIYIHTYIYFINANHTYIYIPYTIHTYKYIDILMCTIHIHTYTVPKLYHPAKIMFLRGAAKCGQKIK